MHIYHSINSDVFHLAFQVAPLLEVIRIEEQKLLQHLIVELPVDRQRQINGRLQVVVEMMAFISALRKYLVQWIHNLCLFLSNLKL